MKELSEIRGTNLEITEVPCAVIASLFCHAYGTDDVIIKDKVYHYGTAKQLHKHSKKNHHLYLWNLDEHGYSIYVYQKRHKKGHEFNFYRLTNHFIERMNERYNLAEISDIVYFIVRFKVTKVYEVKTGQYIFIDETQGNTMRGNISNKGTILLVTAYHSANTKGTKKYKINKKAKVLKEF